MSGALVAGLLRREGLRWRRHHDRDVSGEMGQKMVS